MGNAACTIHHPTSLDVQPPYLESGKQLEATTSLIRFEKRDGAAVGVGGRVAFKKNIKESSWSFKYTKTQSTNIGISVGEEVDVNAVLKAEAVTKLAVQYGIQETEALECFKLIKSVVNDNNEYSELYFYVDYNGKNNGRYNWTKNDLNLQASHRWAEDSEMIVDIKFKFKY